ncbi:serglycin [Poeciliopsis prolifica]|uniref:serglycin n=1 Tax=Poeciliopsis prolifica TaxID=188132 RepID=UPI00072C638D|nr:serglycin [Poeciliopsis prolifica]
MKVVLLLAVACLALHEGKGAPRTAVYKFLRCNPADGRVNCVTQQSPEMPWSPELPSKLPASEADSLDAEPVEDESPPGEDPKEDEDETQMRSEDGESPWFVPEEEGSGYEGSAADYWSVADEPKAAESETGSGEFWTDSVQPKVGKVRGMKRLFPGSFLVEEAKPTKQDLEEDSLLKI